MTKKVGDTLFIYGEPDAKCESCGEVDELRPYGKDGANICYECAMKDKSTTKVMFVKRMNGVE